LNNCTLAEKRNELGSQVVVVVCEDAAGLLPSNQSRAHYIVHSDRGGGTNAEAVLRTNGQTSVSTALLRASQLNTGSKFVEERE
jgi:hypothetical protein